MTKNYVAVFEMTSWLGVTQHIVKGDDASELLTNFEDIQSLHCLIRHGRYEEDENGQKELDKLEEILDKRDSGELTIEELKKMDINLSLGYIKCIAIFEGEGAEERIKSVFPNAK